MDEFPPDRYKHVTADAYQIVMNWLLTRAQNKRAELSTYWGFTVKMDSEFEDYDIDGKLVISSSAEGMIYKFSQQSRDFRNKIKNIIENSLKSAGENNETGVDADTLVDDLVHYIWEEPEDEDFEIHTFELFDIEGP